VLLARSEIGRAKLRFGLLAGAVGLLVFLILFFQVLLGSLITSFIGAIREQSAPVLVYGEDARQNVAGSIITPPQVEAIAAVDGVAASAPLGEATFTMVADGEQVDASIFGFQPGGPGEPTNVVAGRLPAAPGEALASRESAQEGFGLGDTVSTASGGAELVIVGQTANSLYSAAPTLWTDFDTYGELRRAVNPDAAAVLPSLVAVQPADGVDASTLADRITAEVEGVEALTRDDAAARAPGVAEVNTSFFLVLGLTFVVVTLVVGFFFLILTVQKQDALVLLRAVGASPGYLIGNLFTQIAVVMGLGLLVAYGLLALFVSGSDAGLPLTVSVGTVLATSVAVVVLAALGASVAIVRVVREDPATVVSRQSLGGLA
jgi:putative ABC transport system permease protein